MLDFLGIGAHKCGTTWLFEHLRAHPGISFPAGKEVHFWDKQRHLGVPWWLDLFDDPPDRRRKGEITPAYAILAPDVIAEIFAACPDVSLFMSLRNPMARTWSAALQGLDRVQLPFDQASDRWFIDYFHSDGSLRRGSYLRCIDNWRSFYPRDRLSIIWFDDIVSQPAGVLQSLAAHIGVDPAFFSAHPPTELKVAVHSGPKLPIRDRLLDELRRMYLPEIDALSAYSGRDLAAWKAWPEGGY